MTLSHDDPYWPLNCTVVTPGAFLIVKRVGSLKSGNAPAHPVKSSDSLDPVTGPAMEVRYCYYDNGFAIDAVDQPVRESRQTAAANARLDLRI